jgi:SAM-dependent methyltransferase
MPTDKKIIQAYNKNYKEWLEKRGPEIFYLEKPAMYSALGSVYKKTILCLGCGAGEECAHIKSLGAKRVVGIDISKSLIDIAKKNYHDIEFKVMDIEKLKFSQSSFDLAYSSLVLHYVKDWTKVLSNVRKVLKKNGIFLFSTINPIYFSAFKKENKNEKLRILGYKKNKRTQKIKIYGDYFNIRKINDVWFDNFEITYYHKTFSSIIKYILKSGFKIIDCIEPKPLDSVKRIDFEFWEEASKLALFIIFKLQK